MVKLYIRVFWIKNQPRCVHHSTQRSQHCYYICSNASKCHAYTHSDNENISTSDKDNVLKHSPLEKKV